MKKSIWYELLHYVLVFGVLLVSWIPIMNATGNLNKTIVIAFLVFVLADQLAHKYLLGEEFMWAKYL